MRRWVDSGLSDTDYFFGVSRFRYTRARRVDGEVNNRFFLEDGLVEGAVLAFNEIDFGLVWAFDRLMKF